MQELNIKNTCKESVMSEYSLSVGNLIADKGDPISPIYINAEVTNAKRLL
jgi:hypothetical protein